MIKPKPSTLKWKIKGEKNEEEKIHKGFVGLEQLTNKYDISMIHERIDSFCLWRSIDIIIEGGFIFNDYFLPNLGCLVVEKGEKKM